MNGYAGVEDQGQQIQDLGDGQGSGQPVSEHAQEVQTESSPRNRLTATILEV